MGKRKLDRAIVRAQLLEPFALTGKALVKGQFRQALTFPGMGVGPLDRLSGKPKATMKLGW